MLDSNNKSDKLNEVAQLQLYRDFLKHEFLVVSWVLWFRMFVEIVLLLKIVDNARDIINVWEIN